MEQRGVSKWQDKSLYWMWTLTRNKDNEAATSSKQEATILYMDQNTEVGHGDIAAEDYFNKKKIVIGEMAL